MEPTYVFQDALYIKGIAARTTNEREARGEGKIPGLWERFFTTDVSGRAKAVKNPHLTYTLYANYENGAAGEYTVLIGHESEAGEAEEGMEVISVPAAKYAVFTSERGPVGAVVTEAWKRIWEWSATSQERRTLTGDFELYDARDFDPQNAVVRIYVAVE
ncbi:GyrI-like domain-containing protein [Brevibacillus borstelensis]|uniref:GyrI-like domain-containing protein n=1 Tax=Brevibacillus borstelensis TaxID=45462 RepID=UPI002E1E8C38|nr:GyrI-like domain-containing protein [Brevibacillus borstelensis]